MKTIIHYTIRKYTPEDENILLALIEREGNA